VEVRPLLVQSDTVDITRRAESFYEIRITGPSNYVGVYRLPPLQGFPPIATEPLSNTTNLVALGGTMAPKQ
jgi:hypothetical protein